MTESIISFFNTQENLVIINDLKLYGLKFEIEEDNNIRTNKLNSQIFVVSGVFSKFSRDELRSYIENNGGKVKSSISSKTDYLVAGDNMGPSKKEKAINLNVEIISEDEFIELLNF